MDVLHVQDWDARLRSSGLSACYGGPGGERDAVSVLPAPRSHRPRGLHPGADEAAARVRVEPGHFRLHQRQVRDRDRVQRAGAPHGPRGLLSRRGEPFPVADAQQQRAEPRHHHRGVREVLVIRLGPGRAGSRRLEDDVRELVRQNRQDLLIVVSMAVRHLDAGAVVHEFHPAGCVLGETGESHAEARKADAETAGDERRGAIQELAAAPGDEGQAIERRLAQDRRIAKGPRDRAHVPVEARVFRVEVEGADERVAAAVEIRARRVGWPRLWEQEHDERERGAGPHTGFPISPPKRRGPRPCPRRAGRSRPGPAAPTRRRRGTAG